MCHPPIPKKTNRKLVRIIKKKYPRFFYLWFYDIVISNNKLQCIKFKALLGLHVMNWSKPSCVKILTKYHIHLSTSPCSRD